MSEDWYWGIDLERIEGGPLNSREDAIEEALGEIADRDEGDETFWTGRSDQLSGKDFPVDGRDVLEQAGCEASEMVGEVADGWPSLVAFTLGRETRAEVTELGERLSKVLADWIDEHDPPTFWRTVDVKEHKVLKDKGVS